MKLRLGIVPKLTLVFVLFAALLVASLGSLVYNNARASLQTANVSALLSTALEKQTALNVWVEERQQNVASLAASPNLTEEAANLVTAEPDSVEARMAHDRLVSDFAPHVKPLGVFLEIMALDPETGEVLASTDSSEAGKFKENLLYFINGRDGAYVQNVYYSVTLQAPAMTASAPIHSKDGRLLVVLAARIDLEEMNTIITRHTGLHQSNEAFLVNTSNLFVTQPRLITDPAVLLRGIHIEAVKRCLTHSSGVISALDYRANPALIVYRWLPERQLCMIVKIDEAEALAPANALRGTILTVSGFILISASALAYWLATGITRPIRSLQEGVARFGRGELDYQINVRSADEIGRLACEMTGMANTLAEKDAQLRGYTAELEQRVAERTAELRNSEERFRTAFEQAAVGIAHVGTNGLWLRVNQRLCDIVGYTAAELLGITFQDITHPDDLQTDLNFVHQVLVDEIKKYSLEKRYIRKDHSIVWTNLTVSLVRETSGEPKYFISVVEDITDRKRTEEELKRSNAELEQFAYVASHDLQEPLRAVAGMVQLLGQRYQGKLDERADEYIDLAVEAATRMQKLINDLLEYSRVNRQGKSFVITNMAAALKIALANLQVAIQESNAVVTHDALPTVFADVTQLAQVFQNLIGNALKFRGVGPLRIHLGAEKVEHAWRFAVRDNGIGIEPQYFERIFLVFQRLHTRREYPGTGIGLALCKKIVERHGGQIWVESQPGQGSTFYFTIPEKNI